MTDDPDWRVRLAAFAALERLVLAHGGRLAWQEIARGFSVRGELVHFASKPRGIFKPKQMSAALSVKTSRPRAGRPSWYRDQASAVDEQTGLVPYDLARKSAAESNRHLQLAFERKAPIIYFRAVREAVYEAIWPVWVEQFSEGESRVLLAANDTAYQNVSSVRAVFPDQTESREPSYYLVETRRRNHQA